MGTVRRLDDSRGAAVRRYRNGESARSIAATLGRSRQWVHKRLTRAAAGGPDWASDRSRRPHVSPQALPAAVVEAVRLDVFGERFLLPPEAQYAYVVGTVDVGRQRLTVLLDGEPIAEWPYALRK